MSRDSMPVAVPLPFALAGGCYTEDQYNIMKCHELLDSVNVPQDNTNNTKAKQLFARLSTYIDLKECVTNGCSSDIQQNLEY